MPGFLAAMMVAGILPFGGGHPAPILPVEAEGDIPFQLDAARFLVDRQLETYIYVSLPLGKLRASPDSSGFARLEVRVEFEGADGGKIASVLRPAWIPLSEGASGDSSANPRRLLTLRSPCPPETRQIMVHAEDLSGSKRWLFGAFGRKRFWGEASGRFEEDSLSCGLSDILFAWDVDRSQQKAGLPVRERVLPNPERYYGLYHTTLLYYVEGYGPSHRLWHRIRDLMDNRVVQSGADSSRSVTPGGSAFLLAADLSTLPAGAYRLELLRSPADSCSRSGEFQVLWDAGSWSESQKELLQEAYVLLGPEEYERVQEMSRGEVESYMRELWRSHDPSPSTAANELREIFRQRVEYADRFFGTSFRRGMLTDRGRVYVRYGPPDDVDKELNPQDKDLIARILPGELSDEGYGEIRKPAPRALRDDAAYEIWTYQIRGRPLFPEQQVPVQHTGLKFIFVDELGYGDMRLIYTNISGGF